MTQSVREYEGTKVRKDGTGPVRSYRRTLVQPSAELAVAIAQLVQQHGRAAVKAACEEVLKRHVVEATREQKEHLARLITSLKGVWSRDEIMRCLMLHRGKGIPVAISLEILDVVDRVRPAKPWALINHVVHKDYPQWA